RMAVHTFYPARYYNTLGSHEPGLTIQDGDTVVTTTVDAGGSDSEGKAVAERPNAQTGPFFVEGAEPGDTLAVTLDHLYPNRDSGYTRLTVAENVVDPSFVRELPKNARIDWRIDREGGYAELIDPPASLKNLRLALAPMVGCFGVAPERGQAISTATSGEHGGNMDYRGFKAGATAYFPVFVP